MTRSSPSAETGLRIPRWIAATAAGIYALALLIVWELGCVWMDRRSENMLRDARVTFAEHLEELIHAVQWFQSNLACDALDSWTNATPRSVAQMQEVAGRLYIDELNIVSSNGIVIASNIPKVVGDDWRANPQTSAILELISPNFRLNRMMQPRMSQPFRHGTINPEYYCTYFAEALLDRSGIIELGFTIDRLVSVIAYSDSNNIRGWRFGRRGHFTAIDRVEDGVPDEVPHGAQGAAFEAGVIDHVVENGEKAYRLTFAYAGHLFAAILPAGEFGGQRLFAFSVFALTSAVLILLFALILVRLDRASRRVAALHCEAEARNASDLATARKIQLSSLPRVATFSPDAMSFALSAATHPAREVGGDYYDFFWAPDGRLALVIADVAGKGVPAALFMYEAKHAFPEALRAADGLPEAVATMNAWLCSNNEAEMFVTAWFGLLDTKSGILEYVNAGHCRPYLLPAAGAPVPLAERGGRFLGTFPEATYRSTCRRLAPGDRIVLYTDGIPEAMGASRNPFGPGRFESLLATHPADILGATIDAVTTYTGYVSQSDDLTMLVASWFGHPQSVSRTFPVDADTPGACIAFLREHIRLADARKKARLLNAADELVANVVSYSHADGLTLEVVNAGERCRVVLSDDGIPYNPLAHRDPDTHLALEDRPEGGLGILMVKRLVSYVSWTRDGSFNHTTLVQNGNDCR